MSVDHKQPVSVVHVLADNRELIDQLGEMPFEKLRQLRAVARADAAISAEALRLEKACIEQRIVDDPESGYASLKNESERTRFLIARIAGDEQFKQLVSSDISRRLIVELFDIEVERREEVYRQQKLAQRTHELEQGDRALALREQELEDGRAELALRVRVADQQDRMARFAEESLRTQEAASLSSLAASGKVARG